MTAEEFLSLDRFSRLAQLGVATIHPGGLAATHRLARMLGLAPGMRVLEIGSGTGKTACMLARTYGCSITGLEPSSRMLQQARARAEQERADVTFVQGDALAMPFEPGTFDAAFSESVLIFLDRERALGEYRRVTRPGGRVGEITMTKVAELDPALLERGMELEKVRWDLDYASDWLELFDRVGLVEVMAESNPSIADSVQIRSFFEDGLAGIRTAAAVARLWLSSGAIRRYVRDVAAFYREARQGFGYGIFVGTVPR